MSEPSTGNTSIGYPVTIAKFWVMSILTFNLFVFYWSYKNFVGFKVPSGKRISAFVYALFFPLSFFSLMKGFEKVAQERQYKVHFHKYWLAWLYFGTVTASKFMDEKLFLLALLLAAISLGFVHPLVKHIYNLNLQLGPGAVMNSGISVWNVLFIVIVWTILLAVFIVALLTS